MTASRMTNADFVREVASRRARVRLEGIPRFLTATKPRFCLAVAKFVDGRLAKVPTSLSGNSLDITSPAAGSRDVGKVLEQFKRDPRAIGIGLILPHDDLVVLDFDHCLEGGAWHPQLQELLRVSQSYAEISSSGKGAHLFLRVRDAISRFGNSRGELNGLSTEVYTHKRYIACTFDVYPGAGLHLTDGESVLAMLAELKCTSGVNGLPPSAMNRAVASIEYRGQRSVEMTDEAIFRLCRRARNHRKFSALFDGGDTITYHDGDWSRADAALLSMLAFYTQRPVQLERLFNASALALREKWQNRIDYRVRTIQAALSGSGDVE